MATTDTVLKGIKKIEDDVKIVSGYITTAEMAWNQEHPNNKLDPKTLNNLKITIEKVADSLKKH